MASMKSSCPRSQLFAREARFATLVVPLELPSTSLTFTDCSQRLAHMKPELKMLRLSTLSQRARRSQHKTT
jgi:hypothetical protein